MKRFLIAIAVIVTGAALYYGYYLYNSSVSLDKWSFIPSDAGVVIDTKLLGALDEIKKYPLWNILKQSTLTENIDEGITFLDSINGEKGFTRIFKETPTLISIHRVGKDKIDYLFVIDLQNISQNTFLNAVVGNLEKEGYRFSTRNYNNFDISEIAKKNESFTYIYYKNYLICSFTPYLVEDAIRTVNDPEIKGFKVSQVTKRNENELTIHVNGEKTKELLKSLFSEVSDIPFEGANFELLQDSSFIYLSGNAYIKDSHLEAYVSEAAAFDMVEVIPSNASYVHHYTGTDINQWGQKQIQMIKKEKSTAKLIDSLNAKFDYDPRQVFNLLSDEMAYVQIEPRGTTDLPNLFILEVKDMGQALNFFKSTSERVVNALGDTLYSEAYSVNEIRFLPINRFPQTILGNIAQSFDQCFYIGYRNFLVFSNELNQLKQLISAIEEESTWGKSIEYYDFFQKASFTANYSLFVNIPRTYSILENNLNPSKKQLIKDQRNTIQQLDLIAFQYSYLDHNYFANITISQPIINDLRLPKSAPERDIRFSDKIITKPYLVRSHAHKKFDVIVQDGNFTVFSLDQNQNAQWTETLNSKIVSDIFEIDYYKNGKIQYAFATKEGIHIIDRTGEYIPGFPKTIHEVNAIDQFSLIDYEKNRNYRLAITDTDGKVFLSNKELLPLEGWKPKDLSRKAIKPLRHARLGRRDIMISIQENGIINAMNRRGENLEGFPFDIGESISDTYFLKSSNTLATSTISAISLNGQLIEVSLEGNVVRREQLLKEKQETSFALLVGRQEKSYLIIRKSGNTFDILDDTGNLLFSKDYMTDSKVICQYYQFGAGRDFVIFNDTSSENLYIYDKSGKLVTDGPLPSGNEISLLYLSANKEFQVYTTNGANLETFRFRN